MCELCIEKKEKFIKEFKETLKGGVEAVENYGGNTVKVNNPAFKLLIQLGQNTDEDIYLKASDREMIVDYFIDIVYDITALSKELDSCYQAIQEQGEMDLLLSEDEDDNPTLH